MSRSWPTVLMVPLLWAGSVVQAADKPPIKPDSAGINRLATPFLKAHCLRCHGPDEAKGGLRLDRLDADLSQPTTFERWREIVSRVQSGEMPPKNEPRPKPEQVADFVKRLTSRLDEAPAKQRADPRL